MAASGGKVIDPNGMARYSTTGFSLPLTMAFLPRLKPASPSPTPLGGSNTAQSTLHEV
jgi:hypothetical protein